MSRVAKRVIDLPQGVTDACQATRQEGADADLLLHVVDAAKPNYPEQIEQVQRVLHEIGAADVPQLLVFNKLDALADSQRPRALADSYELEGKPVGRLFVSAQSGEGLAGLREALSAQVQARTPAVQDFAELHETPV